MVLIISTSTNCEKERKIKVIEACMVIQSLGVNVIASKGAHLLTMGTINDLLILNSNLMAKH
jgi:hypothetical protein